MYNTIKLVAAGKELSAYFSQTSYSNFIPVTAAYLPLLRGRILSLMLDLLQSRGRRTHEVVFYKVGYQSK
jgi:hypothetical protein